MQDQWLPFTNQKLHFARLQLDAWEKSDSRESGAFRQAFLFHAVAAYRSMIAELLISYGVNVDTLPDLQEAREHLNQKQEVSSELSMLEGLEKERGWLSSLLEQYKGLFSSGNYEPGRNGGSAVIALTDVSVENINTVEDARFILDSLKEVLLHFRNYNLEY